MKEEPFLKDGDLLPCPFCGTLPQVARGTGGGGRSVWYVQCANNACDVIVEIASQQTRELAVELWNRRA